MPSAAEASFNSLSTIAVVFSTLSSLFGVYFVLFILAIWSTYRRDSLSYRRLRLITILLFLVLLVHYVTRAVAFGRGRIFVQPADEQSRWLIPLLFMGSVTVTLAGLLSDGLVAWRFYVIFERRSWALYIPSTAVVINALLGLSGDIQYMLIYRNFDKYVSSTLTVAFKISVAWGWCMFAINTVLTAGILIKILGVARKFSGRVITKHHQIPYLVVLEAISESALINWVGLLLYEIATLAPVHGHITSELNVGYVMFCILPIFFGISQCLITVRLCILNETGPSSRLGSSRYSEDRSLQLSGGSSGSYSNQDRRAVVVLGHELSSTRSGHSDDKAVAFDVPVKDIA